MGDDGGGQQVSPDGVAPSWMVVCLPLLSHLDFFWHQLTRVVPEKEPQNGCMYVYVCYLLIGDCQDSHIHHFSVHFLDEAVPYADHLHLAADR